LISNDTKIIITTNRTIEEIEPALLRDGRCFDILRLNKINIEENKDLLKKIIKDNHLSNELLKEENVSQAKIMNKINEKLDNNEKNYIIDKKISLKEAFILDKIRKRA
jgi:ATP-dependent 26S proteasome regulatory subunit